MIMLKLSMRAYLLMREEYPLAQRYLKTENECYVFSGPVTSHTGIGRFVLGLINEIEVVAPKEFVDYVENRSRERMRF